jgi:hypothetical protein
MLIKNSAIVAIILSMLLSATAYAEGQKLRDKLSQGTLTITAQVKGCDEDAEKLCPGLPLGSEKAFMCLMAYEEKLSNRCKLGISEAAMAIKMSAAALDYSARACEADADKHCLNVQPGEGRIVACLKKNEKNVSKDCVSVLKETGLWDAELK